MPRRDLPCLARFYPQSLKKVELKPNPFLKKPAEPPVKKPE